MKVFVSGATGFIGIQLVKRLLSNGHEVHALYRSESKADLIRLPGVKLFKGDILDIRSLEDAMQSCDQAYHTAAFAGCEDDDGDRVGKVHGLGTFFGRYFTRIAFWTRIRGFQRHLNNLYGIIVTNNRCKVARWI